MKFLEASVNGALLVEPKIIADDRGYFTRAFCAQEFRDAGVDLFVSQANLAGSRHRGTLRGMHYQVDPYEEGKLLRCIKGAVFDVVLDVREDSNTYGKWYGCVLTASNRNMLYVPPGCAHGYQTLEDDTEVYYLVSESYNPGSERGIRWDDEQFCIDWPIKENPILSDKDRSWPDFRR